MFINILSYSFFMDIETKIDLVKRRPTVELINEDSLCAKLERGEILKHYIGFEISGKAHLGTGLIPYIKINDLLKTKSVKPTIFLADFHTYINNKLGGNLEFIQYVAKTYFKGVFLSFGLEEVDYILASDIYDLDYWKLVLKIGSHTTVSRVKRSLRIMGRKESDSNPSSYYIYPLMQAADILFMNINLVEAGLDQRKVNMLALDVANKLHYEEPIVFHTALLSSLKATGRMDPLDEKMSKSKPDTAIFVHDSEEEIKRKVMNAVCPVGIIEQNPIVDILKQVLIRTDEEEFTIERAKKFGGDITLTIPEFEKEYKEKKIHPLDLKLFVYKRLSDLLKPSRDYFNKHKELLSVFDQHV